MEAGTVVALAAMLISLFLAVLKFVDRRKTVKAQLLEQTKKTMHADVERDSIIVRGAEGALLLMEKTLKTSNDECQKRIDELEEDKEAQACEIKELREENQTQKIEIKELRTEIAEMRKEMKELTRRVDNG
jgi:predicted RNase H-like nuclease (RuvC/YqgF family)